ncbi:MAG: YggS family pyridoxal phosphate-dependent enzyme [Thermodesulfovibrionales bacterium]|nr:YggS family pyridoxal phosphate-dependent enzyme [Thermodesulfovibrionales bacterium]
MVKAGLIENISGIYKRLSHAAMRAGRNPGDVLLIAVSKGVSVELMREAAEAGLRVFGESRVQEAVKKAAELETASSGIRWHMIGHLQKNKAGAAVGLFELIHSLDSVELASLINRHASGKGKVQRVLMEVNLSGERSKHGIGKDEIGSLIKAAAKMENISVEGLMTIPPYSDDPEASRPYYKELKELADGYGLRELSMGMTGDFEVAVEEGATMVRVGTAIFGERIKANIGE